MPNHEVRSIVMALIMLVIALLFVIAYYVPA